MISLIIKESARYILWKAFIYKFVIKGSNFQNVDKSVSPHQSFPNCPKYIYVTKL